MPSGINQGRNLDRQITAIMRNLDKVLIDFTDKDQRKITRAAAQPVARAARNNTTFDDSKRPHTRKRGTETITYIGGNLRRSLRVLSLRRSKDAYVGPQFAKKRASTYGGAGQAVDGYYAAMVHGSALAFRRRELEPALKKGESAALKILTRRSDKAIKTRAVRRGFKTQ